jgi:hypothetical protein
MIQREINPRKGFKMVILESPDDIELLNKDLMTSSRSLIKNIQYIKPK